MRFLYSSGITNHQFVSTDQRELARAIRREPTKAEVLAWDLLRGRRMLGLKFRRQQVIDGFIVDFFCAERALVIEIDGGVHNDPEVAAYDRERALILRCRKLKMVRICNDALSRANLEVAISRALAEAPPLPEGEGAGG